jgi:hypothetical protein
MTKGPWSLRCSAGYLWATFEGESLVTTHDVLSGFRPPISSGPIACCEYDGLPFSAYINKT